MKEADQKKQYPLNHEYDTVVLAAAAAAAGKKAARRMDAVKREVFAEDHPALGAMEHLLRLAFIEADALAGHSRPVRRASSHDRASATTVAHRVKKGLRPGPRGALFNLPI